jgi:hypothetical protein
MAAKRDDRDAERGLILGEEKRVEGGEDGRSIHPVFYIA